MNKFIAFTLLALVASVSCENPEIDLLLGNEKLFSGFCVAQEQRIKSDLSNFSRQTSADITKIFFGSVSEITDDVINVQKDAVAQLTAQLAKPDSEVVDDGNLSENEIARLIKEGKEAIKETNGIAGVVPASKAAFSAMLSTVNSALFTRLAKARAAVSGLSLFNGFKTACDRVAQYEQEMSHALEDAKQEILDDAGNDAQVQDFVQGLNIVNLNCRTTKSIVRLHGFCDTVQAGHKHFFKMLGMESPLEKYE